MRKRRAIIFDDEDIVLNMLEDVFQMRDYEVIGFKSVTSVCPLQRGEAGGCGEAPCADVVLTDFHMPGMDGLELLRRQSGNGCSIDSRNKGVISGNIDGASLRQITDMGCMFFQKPFSIQGLLAWIDQCESRSDIARPLVSRRREERVERRSEISVRRPGTNEVLSVLAVNMSGAGLCLQTAQPLHKEETLNIVTAPPAVPFTRASVRWVRQEGDGSCRAGLQCF